MDKPLPDAAHLYKIRQIHRLIALCHELQIDAGDKPFFLACRAAADVIDSSHMQAARYLQTLTIDGVLQLTKKGERHRAAEYRYVE